jgi:purine-nucleoside phosphorylase
LALKHNVKALSILSVSDNIITNESALPEVREKAFTEMFEVALELI